MKRLLKIFKRLLDISFTGLFEMMKILKVVLVKKIIIFKVKFRKILLEISYSGIVVMMVFLKV